jgi:hypothetical protein
VVVVKVVDPPQMWLPRALTVRANQWVVAVVANLRILRPVQQVMLVVTVMWKYGLVHKSIIFVIKKNYFT